MYPHLEFGCHGFAYPIRKHKFTVCYKCSATTKEPHLRYRIVILNYSHSIHGLRCICSVFWQIIKKKNPAEKSYAFCNCMPYREGKWH